MKTDKTYNSMKCSLEATLKEKEKQIIELSGYAAYLEDQIKLYRQTIKTLEGKLNGKSTGKSGKNSKKQSAGNEHKGRCRNS